MAFFMFSSSGRFARGRGVRGKPVTPEVRFPDSSKEAQRSLEFMGTLKKHV